VISRSCRSTVFGTYHGARVINLRTFAWKRSSISLYAIGPDGFKDDFIGINIYHEIIFIFFHFYIPCKMFSRSPR
jgi:hypothetical protein